MVSAFLGGLLFSCSALAQVDLTPRTGERVVDEEGGTIPVTIFRDGERSIRVDFGEGLAVLGGSPGEVRLAAPDVPASDIRIRVRASGFPRDIEGLRASALGMLPEDAEATGEPGEPSRGMSFVRSAIWSVDVPYVLHKEHYKQRTLFWTFETRQFQFIVRGRASDLDTLAGRVRKALFGWQWDDDRHLRAVEIRVDPGTE